jgi:DNA polymerase III subunit epsilon
VFLFNLGSMNKAFRDKSAAQNQLPPFAAIDFETADYSRDSACALAIVVFDGREITAKKEFLIRPPRKDFVFTYLHGIAWEDVCKKPSFGEIWKDEIKPLFAGVDFLAAHNASFDRSVLEKCCIAAGHQPIETKFICTVKVARKAWQIHPTKLSDVCSKLKIPLDHHNAASDALACAEIILRAHKDGHQIAKFAK